MGGWEFCGFEGVSVMKLDKVTTPADLAAVQADEAFLDSVARDRPVKVIATGQDAVLGAILIEWRRQIDEPLFTGCWRCIECW